MASTNYKSNHWDAFLALVFTLCAVASAHGQSAALDALVRQHERAVQDATGMMNDFMEALRKNPTVEAQDFYGALQAAGGVAASQRKDPTFIQTWMQLTVKDPQFVQYQIDALINQNLYPVVQELQKVGVNFNDLSQAQKDAIFSAAVQHGAGVQAKKIGADNVLERSISVAQTDAQAPSFPTYTRQELVYGQVEDQMRAAEDSKAKLITQQLNLERQKSQLLEQGLGSESVDISKIQNQVKALDQKIGDLSRQVATQDQYIQDAAQYLKSQAQGSLADGEQWLKDFYQQRTQMYPAEAKRYQLELESLLKQYREEQKAKSK